MNINKLYYHIQTESDRISRELRTKTSRRNSFSFFPYAQFHILYAAKIIIEKSHEFDWSDQARNSLVNDAINLVTTVVKNQKRESDYEFFRKARTKRMIDEELSGFQSDLFPIPLTTSE